MNLPSHEIEQFPNISIRAVAIFFSEFVRRMINQQYEIGPSLLDAVYELSALRKLAERGLELMEGQDSELKQRLEEARDLFSYMEREYPLLIERWEKEHKKGSK
jgi:hypothetical protein